MFLTTVFRVVQLKLTFLVINPHGCHSLCRDQVPNDTHNLTYSRCSLQATSGRWHIGLYEVPTFMNDETADLAAPACADI